MAKVTEPTADEIAAAAEQREMQRDLLALYVKSLEEEALPEVSSRHIEACRRMLKELEQSPCGHPAGTTLH
jgi:hypothetical protein